MTDQSTAQRTNDAGESTLDRRRDKMQAAKAAAEAATADVTTLDHQLEAHAGRHTGHEADLQSTLDRVARLKKMIKASTAELGKLRSARKDARRRAAVAEGRAAKAEARYDTAVLADMLRREKEHDLSAHTAPPAAPEFASQDTTAEDAPAKSRASGRPARAAAPRTGTTRRSSTTTRPRTTANGSSDSTDPAEPGA